MAPIRLSRPYVVKSFVNVRIQHQRERTNEAEFFFSFFIFHRHHVDADQDLDPTFHLDADPDSGSNPVLQMLEKKLLPFTPVPFYVVLSFCHPHWCHNIQYFEQNIKIY
jgi:hypothetical protein